MRLLNGVVSSVTKQISVNCGHMHGIWHIICWPKAQQLWGVHVHVHVVDITGSYRMLADHFNLCECVDYLSPMYTQSRYQSQAHCTNCGIRSCTNYGARSIPLRNIIPITQFMVLIVVCLIFRPLRMCVCSLALSLSLSLSSLLFLYMGED